MELWVLSSTVPTESKTVAAEWVAHHGTQGADQGAASHHQTLSPPEARKKAAANRIDQPLHRRNTHTTSEQLRSVTHVQDQLSAELRVSTASYDNHTRSDCTSRHAGAAASR